MPFAERALPLLANRPMPPIARSPSFRLDRLRAVLAEADATLGSEAILRGLVRAGCDRLPLPGGGETLTRWQALAAVAAVDLPLAKRFEGHTDALAILAELAAPTPPQPASIWGVWCAESARQRLVMAPAADGQVLLDGIKTWCSGAAGASHAVVSGWTPAGAPGLAAVALAQPGVTILPGTWLAPGMRDSATGAATSTTGGNRRTRCMTAWARCLAPRRCSAIPNRPSGSMPGPWTSPPGKRTNDRHLHPRP